MGWRSGTKVRLGVRVKNLGVPATFRTPFYFPYMDTDMFFYTAYGIGNWVAGEEKTLHFSKAWPGGYDILVPAFCKGDASRQVWVKVKDEGTGELLDETKQYGLPLEDEPVSVDILKHCFCKGVDSNYNPVGEGTTFNSSEKLYNYIKISYPPEGVRYTFTLWFQDYLPYTGVYQVPSGRDWGWFSVWYWQNPPLPKGKVMAWGKAGRKIGVKEATIV